MLSLAGAAALRIGRNTLIGRVHRAALSLAGKCTAALARTGGHSLRRAGRSAGRRSRLSSGRSRGTCAALHRAVDSARRGAHAVARRADQVTWPAEAAGAAG